MLEERTEGVNERDRTDRPLGPEPDDLLPHPSMVGRVRRGRAGMTVATVIVAAVILMAIAWAGQWACSGPGEDRVAAVPSCLQVDVVVYGTQTSGLAAVRELAMQAPHLRVALVSSGDFLETPLAQGLCVEDARDIARVEGGFYHEWRELVIQAYARQGTLPFIAGDRLVYEPKVATDALWTLLEKGENPNLLYFTGRLVQAGDRPDARYVDIEREGSGFLRLCTRYFIDASLEADLARLLGAGYRVGRHEALYNDLAGPTPAYPSSQNNYETAPQRFSCLLTLRVYLDGNAPPVAALAHPDYDPTSYASGTALAQKNVDAFPSSWTMNIAVLPNDTRELNEGWNDWPDIGLSYQWIFAPEKRGDMCRRVIEWSINRVRYLQEHGYPEVGIASVPQTLYVREGPRILGLDTYTADDLRSGELRQPVALGCYMEYDRHDAFCPNHIETTRYACVPMEALMPRGHPRLLVCTAVSIDYAAYSSAVRMEHTRANMGGAAGIMIVLADRLGLEPGEVPYEEVRRALVERGYRLEVPI